MIDPRSEAQRASIEKARGRRITDAELSEIPVVGGGGQRIGIEAGPKGGWMPVPDRTNQGYVSNNPWTEDHPVKGANAMPYKSLQPLSVSQQMNQRQHGPQWSGMTDPRTGLELNRDDAAALGPLHFSGWRTSGVGPGTPGYRGTGPIDAHIYGDTVAPVNPGAAPYHGTDDWWNLQKRPSIPGRAAGGPVSPGQPYIVGEEGPELIVPQAPGFVLPNSPDVISHGGGFYERPNSYGTATAQYPVPVLPPVPKVPYTGIVPEGAVLMGQNGRAAEPQIPPSAFRLPPPPVPASKSALETPEQYAARRELMNPENINVGITPRLPLVPSWAAPAALNSDALSSGSGPQINQARLNRELEREFRRNPAAALAYQQAQANAEAEAQRFNITQGGINRRAGENIAAQNARAEMTAQEKRNADIVKWQQDQAQFGLEQYLKQQPPVPVPLPGTNHSWIPGANQIVPNMTQGGITDAPMTRMPDGSYRAGGEAFDLTSPGNPAMPQMPIAGAIPGFTGGVRMPARAATADIFKPKGAKTGADDPRKELEARYKSYRTALSNAAESSTGEQQLAFRNQIAALDMEHAKKTGADYNGDGTISPAEAAASAAAKASGSSSPVAAPSSAFLNAVK